MWPFSRSRRPLDEAHLELISQIHGLAQRVKLLEEGLAATDAAHERLRGRFYALKGPSADHDTPRQLTKAELLAKFVPRRS
ncbi:MAG TPA: hypothetical protein VF748_15195 [Candidatus Acidoferrum sp.]